MPYKEVYVRPKKFLTRKGIAIYCTYKNDDMNHGPYDWHYTTNPYGPTGEPDEDFDVRHLPNAPSYIEGDMVASSMNHEAWDHPPFMGYEKPENKTAENEAKWTQFWKDGGYIPQIRRVIKEAIDLGHIKPYQEK